MARLRRPLDAWWLVDIMGLIGGAIDGVRPIGGQTQGGG